MNHKFLVGILILVVVIVSYAFTFGQGDITGNVIAAGSGCCAVSCTITGEAECPEDKYYEAEYCEDVPQCNIGCCIDGEGYCYSNYVKDLCDAEGQQFIGGRECNEFRSCLIAPEAPADQEGYIFANYENVLLTQAQPQAGRKGTEFTISSTLFQPHAGTQIEVKGTNHNGVSYAENISVFDNGITPDGNQDDEQYTALWDSSSFPFIQNYTLITLQTYIGGEASGRNNTFLLSPAGCIPAPGYNTFTKPKILTSIKPGNTNYIVEDSLSPVLTFLNGHGQLNQFDFYYYDEPLAIPLSQADTVCPEQFDDGELIFQLDKNEPSCRQQGNVVTIHTQFTTNRKPLAQNWTTRVCDFVSTQADRIEELFARAQAPTITINAPAANTTLTDETLTYSFTAKDNQSTMLRYKVYLDHDDNKLAWGYMKTNETVTGDVPVEDGTHFLYMQVEDFDENIWIEGAWYDANISNFDATLQQEDNRKFSLNVTNEQNINYTYFIYHDAQLAFAGKGNTNETSLFNISLPQGNYSFWAKVTNEGRQASSDIIDVQLSNSANPLTGNAITLLTGHAVVNPFNTITETEEEEIGEEREDGGVIGPDGFIYYPIDQNGLHEPQKLCGLNGDTGARYFPADCINANFTTLIEADAGIRLWYPENQTWTYEHDYEVTACDFDVYADVYLWNDRTEEKEPIPLTIEGEEEELYSVVLDPGYKLVDGGEYLTYAYYTHLCVMVSDTNVQDLPYCLPFSDAECLDALDNDNDSRCDMDGCFVAGSWLGPDPGCTSVRDLFEGDGTTECQDGIDNDNDGLIDDQDPACRDNQGQYFPQRDDESDGTTQCQDGIDNDGDGVVDLSDPGCLNAADDDESDGTTQCQDGIDNDGDGLIDTEDHGCYDTLDCYSDRSCYNPLDDNEELPVAICDLSDEFEVEYITIERVGDGPYDYVWDYSVYNCGEFAPLTAYLKPFGSVTEADKEVIDSTPLNQNAHHITQASRTSDVRHEQVCFRIENPTLQEPCYTISG